MTVEVRHRNVHSKNGIDLRAKLSEQFFHIYQAADQPARKVVMPEETIPVHEAGYVSTWRDGTADYRVEVDADRDIGEQAVKIGKFRQGRKIGRDAYA